MQFSGDSVDDLLADVLKRLQKSNKISPSKGTARELVATTLVLRNPRARFSRAESRSILFSCLGELLWYLSGREDLAFIRYYIPKYHEFSDDGRTLNGSYGTRIFNFYQPNQFRTVESILLEKKDSRQAVVQVFDSSDLLKETKDVPCTCTMQFFKRRNKLHLLINMRSNDAFIGLPHDIFSFTMMHEIMARSVSSELGIYYHSVGSLHLYDCNERDAQIYLGEGTFSQVAMPSMPLGDPWPAITWLLENEEYFRCGGRDPINAKNIDPYWLDLARLLRMKALYEDGNIREVILEKNSMSSGVYDAYIRSREQIIERRNTDGQLPLVGGSSTRLGAK